jgi:hypothetical protein
MSPERSEGGGRTGAGGFDYQHRVAAWFATHVLAGSSVAPIDQPWRGQLRRVDLETGEPIDDVRLAPSEGADTALQCKRTIQLAQAVSSELQDGRALRLHAELAVGDEETADHVDRSERETRRSAALLG